MERLRFIGKRLIYLVIMLLGVATLVFILTKLIPGDPVTANLSQRALSDPEIVAAYKMRYGLDKPVIVGEWPLGAYDRGMMHPSLQECADQRERAWFYGEYMRGALEHPLIIGVHWHQFMDQATTGHFDGENFQVGFLDCCDTPYPETVAACRRAGYGLYQTRYGSR